jgi:FMN phosphatase YigB (HAD superfamily)
MTFRGGLRQDFVDPVQWRVFPDVFPALDGLSSKGWTHIVLSNHVPEISSIAAGLGLGKRVLRVFNSAETGYAKPHPEAYRRALRTLGDEVEAVVRRVVGAGREEVCVRELCVSHGW